MKALIVDGYNAINKIPSLNKIMDKSLEEARSALTELAREYKRRTGGIAEFYVVFDGKDEYRSHDFCTPKNQVFSRSGQGDSEIVRLVKRMSKDYHVIVASDDNFVRNNARAYNAAVITIAEFFAIAKKKESKKDDMAGKVNPKDIAKINEDLKKRWNI